MLLTPAVSPSVVASQSVDLLTPGSLVFELVKGVPAAFVALVIGLIAAGIAYRQSQIAHAKLKLDLFERRYELYALLRDYLSRGMEVPDSHNGPDVRRFNELRARFSDAVSQAYFLFGREIGSSSSLPGRRRGNTTRRGDAFINCKLTLPTGRKQNRQFWQQKSGRALNAQV